MGKKVYFSPSDQVGNRYVVGVPTRHSSAEKSAVRR